MIHFLFDDFKIKPVLIECQQFDNETIRFLATGEFPVGYSWELLMSIGENLNIITLEAVDGGFAHDLTADELAIKGIYTMQLKGTNGDLVRHTDTQTIYVPLTLSGDAHWPVLPTEFSEALDEAKRLSPPAGGSLSQVLAKASNADYDYYWKTVSGGGGGSSDYLDLDNKPSINGTTLIGNLTVRELPLPTTEGYIPKVVDGEWALAPDLKLSITETENEQGGNTLTIGG